MPKPRKERDNKHERAIAMVVDLAHLKGWRAVYWRQGRTLTGWATPVGGDGRGIPDLFLCRGSIIDMVHQLQQLWFEVKIPPDRVRPEQQAWLDLLGGRVVNPFDEEDWQWIQDRLE